MASAEPSWVKAWTGGRPAVQVGNAAEFNRMTGGDHYSCLALFATPRPGMVVLPQRVEGSWVRDTAELLGWGGVEVHDGVAGDGRVSAAIEADDVLLRRMREAEGPVVPWGWTEAFDRITPAPAGVLEAIGRYESKAGSHRLFRALAPGHRDVVVPAQAPAGTRRALARRLAAGPAVLKREYGVGGNGVLVLPARTRRAGALAREWARPDVVVEEYVPGGGPYRDPTFDAVIDAGGGVHPVGVGAMDVEGTRYQGVTVGPGVLPDDLAATVLRFGTDVGRALASDGYRGWFDVDFVTDREGRPAPTEINLRLTGPAVAFTLKARLDALRGGAHLVRTVDQLRLGARLPPAFLREHLGEIRDACRECGVTVLLTIPTAAFEPDPYVGMAFAARTADALDRAEALARRASGDLGLWFDGLTDRGRRTWIRRTPRPRAPRP